MAARTINNLEIKKIKAAFRNLAEATFDGKYIFETGLNGSVRYHGGHQPYTIVYDCATDKLFFIATDISDALSHKRSNPYQNPEIKEEFGSNRYAPPVIFDLDEHPVDDVHVEITKWTFVPPVTINQYRYCAMLCKPRKRDIEAMDMRRLKKLVEKWS